jgi:hypothetical protein
VKNGKAPGGKALSMVRQYFPQVKRISDATKKEIVEVTQADNQHADVKSHRTCALAIACKRFFSADGVIIGLTTAFIIKGKVAFRFRLADTVSREITSFDRKAGFDAGLYLLVAPCPSDKLGKERSKDPVRKAKDGKGRKAQFRHYTRNVRTTLGRYSAQEAEAA